MNRREITVTGSANHGPLLEAIQSILPVHFVRQTGDSSCVDGALALSYSFQEASGKTLTRTFRAVVDHEAVAVRTCNVSFSNSDLLHECLCARPLAHDETTICRGFQPQPGDVILATADGMPVWVAREREGSIHETTYVSLPVFTGDRAAIDFLNGRNFLRLLPLYHFVRRAVEEDGWVFPAPRASFMFDDPNLHRESYGFISYPEIIRRSEAANYHVAFATIPFDTWYTSPKAAGAFRDHPNRISLLLHGNDHTYAELARVRAAGTDIQLAAQAVARISQFEKRTGLRVCRTMAAPHGACSNDMMAAMLGVGIEGLFCSPWSLRLWDPSRTRLELGIPPAEIMGGFAVFPRFRLSDDCEGSAVLCSLLGQPIVPVGHHQDLRDGVDLLDHVAHAINHLPGVTWADTEELSHSNFISRTEPGDPTMHVISYSSCIRTRIPDGIASVLFHDPRTPAQLPVSSCWLGRHSGADWSSCNPDQGFPVSPGQELTFRLTGLGDRARSDLQHPRLSFSAPVRRFLCESRDRLAPALRSVKLRVHSTSTFRIRRPKPM